MIDTVLTGRFAGRGLTLTDRVTSQAIRRPLGQLARDQLSYDGYTLSTVWPVVVVVVRAPERATPTSRRVRM